MNDYIIITDSACDLPDDIVKEYEGDLFVMPLYLTIEGKTYKDGELDPKDFYAKLRSGVVPTTSQLTPDDSYKVFEEYAKKGIDVVYISFSSALSGTMQSARIAASDLMSDYKDVKVEVVDGLSASTGQGLLVYKALQKKREGLSLDELVKYVEDTRLHICHAFTVDDLFFLHKGGRVSKATAIVGSAMNIKPILHVDNEGRLINIDKTRGRKKSILKLIDYMKQRYEGYEEQNKVLGICHGDCEEDVEFLVSKLKEEFNYDKIIISYTGTVIGAHSGPGTLSLFFEGSGRDL